MKKFSFNCCELFLFIAIFLAISYLTADAAILSLSPSSSSTTVGNIFSVNILLNTQGTSTNGVDIRYLNYPTSILEVQDDNTGVTGVQITPGTLLLKTEFNSVNVSTGRIEFAQSSDVGPAYNGSNGVLATVRFKAIAAGTANVIFDFTLGSTSDANIDDGGADILTSVIDGAYTINAVSDTTPPTRSNGSPSGQLAAGTTQTTISLTTNENATCKYSTIAGVSYASMGDTFTTTGSTNHSTNISGLTNGGSYTYYIRCQDTVGNPNIDDNFYISFSVASGGGGGDTTPPIISAVATSSLTQSSVIVSWTTNEAATSRIDYGLTSSYGSQTALDSAFVTNHSQTISGLTANTLYYFRVLSSDSSGNSAISNDYTFITLLAPIVDSQAPSIPANLAANPVSSSQIDLSWSASTDNVAVSGYKIYRNGVEIATTPNLSYSNTDLAASTAYSYEVAAYDAVNNVSNKSAPVSATTQAASSSPPPITVPPSGGGGGGYTPPPIITSNPAPSQTLGPVQIRDLKILTESNSLIAEKSVINSSIIVFQAMLFDTENNKVRLEVELKKFDEPFTGAPTIFSDYVNSGTTVAIKRGGLVDSSYRFRARARRYSGLLDNPINVVAGDWLWFGDQNTRDFTIIASSAGSLLPSATSTLPIIKIPGFQYVFNSNLFLGLKANKDIKALQKIFNFEGVYPENIISGNFGPLTQKAAIKFQQKYNISPAAGYIGALTRAKLNSLYGGATIPVVISAPSGNLVGPFAVGMQSEQVRLLQTMLAKDKEIYPSGKATGYYGVMTFEAVKKFQSKYGIEQTGVAGPKTRAKINEVLGK